MKKSIALITLLCALSIPSLAAAKGKSLVESLRECAPHTRTDPWGAGTKVKTKIIGKKDGRCHLIREFQGGMQMKCMHSKAYIDMLEGFAKRQNTTSDAFVELQAKECTYAFGN